MYRHKPTAIFTSSLFICQLTELNSLDDKIRCFNIVLRAVLDACAPLRRLRVKSNSPPWMRDSSIKHARYARDAAYRKAIKLQSSETWLTFRRARNYVNYKIRNAKANYFNSLIEQTKNQPRKFWNTFNHLSSKTVKPTINSPFSPTDFNNHFISVSAKITASITPSTLSPTSFISTHCDQTLELHEIDKDLISKLIDQLDVRKAIGCDGISSHLLKLCKPLVVGPLTLFINESIRTSQVPSIYGKQLVCHPYPNVVITQ